MLFTVVSNVLLEVHLSFPVTRRRRLASISIPPMFVVAILRVGGYG